MNGLKDEWRAQLKRSPFVERHFTEQMKRNVLERTKREATARARKWKPVTAAGVLLACGLAAAATYSPEALRDPIRLFPEAAKDLLGSFSSRFEQPKGAVHPRQAYTMDGKNLFIMYPDPTLAAGKEFGYMIHFAEPFETYSGKTLAIYARHEGTGLYVTAHPPRKITEPSPGYLSLGRFTTAFELPLGGNWTYEVELDGQFYGDAVLSVAEGSWETSPMFRSGAFQMRGIERKVGFIDVGFIAGKPNKYMWHFWGGEADLSGEFKVVAVKQGTSRLVSVFEADRLAGGVNGADRTAVSMMTLPERGRWQLMAFVGERYVGSIVVDVKEK